MPSTTSRITAALLALLLMFSAPLAIGCGGSSSSSAPPAAVEDCDAEDLLEGDEDCFGDSDKSKSKKSKKSKSKSKKK